MYVLIQTRKNIVWWASPWFLKVMQFIPLDTALIHKLVS